MLEKTLNEVGGVWLGQCLGWMHPGLPVGVSILEIPLLVDIVEIENEE